MAAETYEIVHASWLETRAKVKALQGEHQRCLNEKGEQTEDMDRRRAEFEEALVVEAEDLNERILTLEQDYNGSVKRLKMQHTRLQELLSEELKRDKGAMAAGLNEAKEDP